MEIQVGIVVVSHSAKIAAGVVDLAAQMAPQVQLKAAGGLDDGGIGTSYDLIEQAVNDLVDQGLSVAIYTDLGSATMTAEMVIDMLGNDAVQLVPAPVVEGAIAGAVAAQQGKSLAEIVNPDAAKPRPATQASNYERTAKIADPLGLHARPAARVAEIAARGKNITLNGEEADSALQVMSLALRQGDEVTISGDPEDAPYVDEIAQFVEAGA